jgi:hypothetical protein
MDFAPNGPMLYISLVACVFLAQPGYPSLRKQIVHGLNGHDLVGINSCGQVTSGSF